MTVAAEVQVFGAVDGVVVLAHEQILSGHEVRASEGDGLLALVGDGVGGEDHVHVAVLNHGLTLLGGGFLPYDLVFGIAEFLGDVFGHVHVEAHVGAGLLEAQAGLVEFDADADLAGFVRAAGGQRHCAGHGGERGDHAASLPFERIGECHWITYPSFSGFVSG